MTELKDLKVTHMLDGWKQYDIQGLSGDECKKILIELCKKYYTIHNHVGRFIGTSEYYGYFLCKDVKICK